LYYPRFIRYVRQKCRRADVINEIYFYHDLSQLRFIKVHIVVIHERLANFAEDIHDSFRHHRTQLLSQDEHDIKYFYIVDPASQL
jgi:hypothetical protein